MRIINFAKRNFKEIIRDPLSIIFAIIFFIIKQLCKFFVKIYLQNDSTFMPNWKQKIFLSHFPCSAKLLSCIIITDIRSILYSKVSCSGGKNHE